MARDPICGMTVEEKTARSAVRDGVTYYFCAEGCRRKFLGDGPNSAPSATAARSPETRSRFDALGAEPVADSPEDYARFVRAEYDRWGKLVRDARIKLD